MIASTRIRPGHSVWDRLLACWTHNPPVVGSSPTRPTCRTATRRYPQVVAVCKTVGSAYVGSNPTPATTSENGPHAAETRPGGPFVLVTACIRACHDGWMRWSGRSPGSRAPPRCCAGSARWSSTAPAISNTMLTACSRSSSICFRCAVRPASTWGIGPLGLSGYKEWRR
jgi:hypothetical protein